MLRLQVSKTFPEFKNYHDGYADDDHKSDDDPSVDFRLAFVLVVVKVLGVYGERGGAVGACVPRLADAAQDRVAEEGVRGTGAGRGAVLPVVALGTELLTAVA